MKVLRDNVEEGRTRVLQDGSWRFWVEPDDIGAGTHTWEAIQTFFPADNTRDSNESAQRVIDFIVGLPGVPEIDPASLLPTNDQTSIISGTGAEDGATITLFADLDGDNAAERNLGTVNVPVGTDGSWNIDLDNVPAFGGLPEGEVTLVAIQTNPAGASVGSGTGIGTTENPADRIEIDLTSPATPTIDELQNTPIRTPVITGTGEPGAAVVVRATVPGQPAGTAISDGNVASIAVENGGSGYTTATVEITGGGATSPATATATIVAGVITEITITDPGSGYTSVPTFTITGDGADAIATAAMIQQIGTAVVDQNGTWLLTSVTLPEGPVDISLSVIQTNTAGNVSDEGQGSIEINPNVASIDDVVTNNGDHHWYWYRRSHCHAFC